MGDKCESEILNEVKCISQVKIKEEVIITENTSDSDSTLSDSEKNSDVKLNECEVCCKYHSMFIILKNHECSAEGDDNQCLFCNEISHWLICFEIHKESHKFEADHSSDSTSSDWEENDKKCKICLKYEFMVPLLNSHVCKVNNNHNNKCQDCNEVLLWMSCYKSHIESHEAKSSLLKFKEENLSDSTTSDTEEMQKILSKTKSNHATKCPVCLKYQIMFLILKNHACQSKLNISCKECDEILLWKDCFEHHKKTHLNWNKVKKINDQKHLVYKFECGICLKLNSIVTSLMKNHSCIDNKSCLICQEVSYWLSCLNNHKRSDLNSDTDMTLNKDVEKVKLTWEQTNCAVCFKFHSVLINLNDHDCLKKKRRQKCETCMEAIFWVRNFRQHESHHSKQFLPLKNFLSCSLCGKKFSSEKMLNVHNSYCKNSSFSCEMCDQKFTDVSSLKKHKIFKSCHIPTIGFQYICKLCNETFQNSLNLTNHEKIHKNLKLFKCHKCLSKFNSEHFLKKHKKIHR